MKIIQTYICENCGKESRDKEEIQLCEARHIGLKSTKELADYKYLECQAKHCGYMVSVTNNDHTRSDYDEAIAKLIMFEREHNMTV